MIVSILKKIAMVVPILIIVSALLFVLLDLLPGDAADAQASLDATAEEVAALRERLGLNRSVIERYGDWLLSVCQGDFGESFINGASVSEKIAQRLPVTLELTMLSMFIAILTAIPLAVLAATHRNGWIDTLSSMLSTVGLSAPHFWLGMLMVLLFSVRLGWLPTSGYVPIRTDLGENLVHMLMPAFTIGFSFSATIMRQTRSAVLDVLNQEYICTAKAKGLPGNKIVWKHAFKNALIPVVTVLGMQMGRLFGGAVVMETLFAIPGLGRAIVDSIFSRDYQVTLGCIMVVAILIIIINTAVDILYVIIDPRISHGAKGKKA